MAKQIINIGAAPNDSTGDALRTAFDKINDNFNELYNVSGAGTGNNLALSGNSLISEDLNGDIILDPNGTGSITASSDITVTGDAVFSGSVGVTGNITGDVTGTVSSVANHTTTDLAEGVNLYHTDAKAIAAVDNSTLTSLTVGDLSVSTNNIISNTINADIVLAPNGTGTVDLNVGTQLTVGAAGGSGALPATPEGYLKIKIAGADYVVPFFASI